MNCFWRNEIYDTNALPLHVWSLVIVVARTQLIDTSMAIQPEAPNAKHWTHRALYEAHSQNLVLPVLCVPCSLDSIACEVSHWALCAGGARAAQPDQPE